MRTIFFFLPCLLAGILLQAQTITINNNDMPVPDDTLRVSVAAGFSHDATLTGTSYTWDYSDLVPASQRVDTFVSVLNTLITYNLVFNNFLDQEHKATVATPNPNSPSFITQVQITDSYDFFKNSSSAYAKVGFGAKINALPTAIRYNDPQQYFKFPLTMGASDSSTTVYGFPVPGFGYYGQTIIQKNTVDGWGTLITPYGTFDVIRVKSAIQTTDTIHIDSLGFGFNIPRPSQTIYKWMGDNQGIPLLTVTGSGMMASAEYRDSVRNLYTQIPEIKTETSFSVFPNPAAGDFCISVQQDEPADVEINILDLTGRTKENLYQGSLVAGTTRMIFSANKMDLAGGIYLVQVKSGTHIMVQKLVLQ
jgi:hypothetical protein